MRKRVGALVGVMVTGLSLAVFCAFFLYPAVRTLRGWWMVQSWVPARAEVIEANLEHSLQWANGATSRLPHQVNVVIRAQASYRYTYEGREYEGHLVSVHDQNEYFQRALFLALKAAHEQGQPITVYVDPRDPRRAIYCRESGADWAKYLAAALGILFLGALIANGLLPGKALIVWAFSLLSFGLPATITLFVVLDGTWLRAFFDMRALGPSSLPVPDPFHSGGVLRACHNQFRQHPILTVLLVLFDLLGAWLVLGMIWTRLRRLRPRGVQGDPANHKAGR